MGQESWVENPLRGPSQLIKIGKLGDVESVFDFNYYEGLHNLDGKAVESNANGVALSPDQSIWITDAGGELDRASRSRWECDQFGGVSSG